MLRLRLDVRFCTKVAQLLDPKLDFTFLEQELGLWTPVIDGARRSEYRICLICKEMHECFLQCQGEAPREPALIVLELQNRGEIMREDRCPPVVDTCSSP